MPNQKRQIAKKAWIKDLLEGTYVKVEKDWTPNYIITKNKREISRADIMGVVVSLGDEGDLSRRQIVVDDGSGRIPVVSFDTTGNVFAHIVIGDVIMVIGRPREFGSEKYVMPEIIKKIDDPKFIELRKAELKKIDLENPVVIMKEAEDVPAIVKDKPAVDAVEDAATDSNPAQKIYNLIKELDDGDGADIDNVIAKSGITDTEKCINTLLEEGEIFEIKRGRLKVLE